MNVYVVSFRLYLIWFIIVHMIGIFTFLTTNLILGIITEVVCTLAIYFLAQPAIKRYQYFFNNSGYSSGKMFVIIAGAHLLIFSTLISVIYWFK